MEVLRKLQLWMDPLKRSGPEAMAVDEWLLETAVSSVLRVYHWDDDWASLGYFGKIGEARAAIPEVQWVRRWTGGGMVDHRADWTYTLVIPQSEPLANLRGAQSYREIHRMIAVALGVEEIHVILSSGEEETGASLCFENPVSYDLVSPDGRKIGGAGQRRTRQGLLHQGSLSLSCDALKSVTRAENLAACLCPSWQQLDFHPDPEQISFRTAARYSQKKWTEKR